MIRAVIDTNVLVSAIRSKRGASYRLLTTLGEGEWELQYSTTLLLEYEAILARESDRIGLSRAVIDDILDRVCATGRENRIYFRWRPTLHDPNDEFLLELALRCECEYVVTFNQRHLRTAEHYRFQVVTPQEFLTIIKA